MSSARDLLGQLFQAGIGRNARGRIEHAIGPRGLGREDNPLSKWLSQISGVRSSAYQGGMSDVIDQAGDLFGSASSSSVRRGNPLAIGGLGALAGVLLGGGSPAMGGAVGGGLIGVLGALAVNVMMNRSKAMDSPEQKIDEKPLGILEPQTLAEERRMEETAGLVLRAMVNAAKADGAISGAELDRILRKLEVNGADDGEKLAIMAEMRKPADFEGMIRDVRDQEMAIQVYAASLLAIEVDTAAEREYLLNLAKALQLESVTIKQIHETLGVQFVASS